MSTRRTDIIDLTNLKPSSDNRPLVSVIVPSYNVEEYIDQCLTSILDNGYHNIELLVIDDRSTDGTVDHIKALMKKDKRIQLFHNPENHNIYGGACRNIGLDHAKGKYVYFCDSDDYILPGLISECVRKMERLNAEICCFKYKKLCIESGILQEMPFCLRFDRLDKSIEVYNYRNTNDILQITYPQVWVKFYSRQFVQQCGIRFSETKNSNDVKFSIFTQLSAKRLIYIPNEFYVYRFETGTSVQLDRIKRDSGQDFICSVKDTWECVKLLKSRIAEQQFVDWVSTQISWNIPKRNMEARKNFVDQMVEFFTGIEYYSGKIESMLSHGYDSTQCFDSAINDRFHTIYVNSDAFTKNLCNLSDSFDLTIQEFGKDNIRNFVFSRLKDLPFDRQYEKLVKYLPLLIKKPQQRPIRNIALYYNWISPRGGIQTFLECSIKMFKKMGYNVVLVTTTPKNQLKIDVDDVKVEVIGRRLKYQNESLDNIIAYENELNGILTRNCIDLFYTQDWSHYISLFDLVTANGCGCFTLMHYHNNPLANKRNNSPLWLLQYSMLKYFDYCISLSSCAERFFDEVGVHNKYIPNIISEKLNSLIDESPPYSKTIDVLWVGRLCMAKGVDRLLWVLKNLQKKTQQTLKVKIIGVWYNDFGSVYKFNQMQNHFSSEIKTLCESGKLDITFQEEYDSDRIYDYMKKSKVLLYTSIYDGYPYVIAESLANGLPVVAYSQPEIELFKDERCVRQFVDSEYASMLVLNVLGLPVEDYAKTQLDCKQFMKGIYRSGEIERTWGWMLNKGIFETNYAQKKVSSFFSMILNNI